MPTMVTMRGEAPTAPRGTREPQAWIQDVWSVVILQVLYYLQIRKNSTTLNALDLPTGFAISVDDYGMPKMILIQLTKYHATFKILFNSIKYIVQLLKYGATFRNISYNSGRMYIFWEHVK